MTHAAPTSEKTRRILIGSMFIFAFIAITLATLWAGSQFKDYATRPDVRPTPTTVATPADVTISSPIPTPDPSCGPGELWSVYASKCYIPEGTTQIDAIPTTPICPSGQIWSRYASKCYVPPGKNGS